MNDRLQGLCVWYALGNKEHAADYPSSHGAVGLSQIKLQDDSLVEVTGLANQGTIVQLSFKTRKGEVHGPYGTGTAVPFTFSGGEIIAFHGHEHAQGLHSLGVYFK